MRLLKKLYDLLEARERWQLLGLGFCMLLMALLQTAGVASILPFMHVVSNPVLIEDNHWLQAIYARLGFSSTQSFLVFLGLVVVVVFSVNNAFSAFTTWLMHRFAWSQNHRLSTRLLGRYLSRPYSFYLSRNTAGLNRSILAEVHTVIQGVMLAALQFLSTLLVAVLLVCLLAAIDLGLALTIGLVLGGGRTVPSMSTSGASNVDWAWNG